MYAIYDAYIGVVLGVNGAAYMACMECLDIRHVFVGAQRLFLPHLRAEGLLLVA